MSKLIPIDDAAKMLGLTPSKLNDLRLKGEVIGVRDGASWKFKLDELQRYADDRGISLSSGDADLDFDLSSDSLVITESSDEVILKDSDSIDLSDDLRDSSELSFGSSDIALASESGKGLGPNDTGIGSGSKKSKRPADDLLGDEDSVELASDFDESDLVLEDSDSSDEVALEANDSGINLSPTDSGISLEEEPLELGGSDIDSLELPEDDDAISLEDAGDFDAPTELRAEDDFNLTPLEEALDDESSGSQVIALEDSDLFTDDSVPTMLSDSDVIEQPALIPVDSTGVPGLVVGPTGASTVVVEPETPYSLWQTLSLSGAVVMTTLCAVVAFDCARNIWQGSDSSPVTATVMNFFVRMLGWDA